MKWFSRMFSGTRKAMNLAQYVENLFSGQNSALHVGDPYSRVDAVSACIMAKWTALDSIPWLLFDKGNNLVESGSAWDLLRNPHPHVTRTQFLAWLTISLDVRGKAFFWIEADDRMEPVALWPLVPQNMTPYFRVHPETGTKLVEFWRYSSPSGKQVNFLPQELLTFRYPHPTDWWDGLPRLGPASLAVSQYHAATEFQARSFANDGMVSGLLTAKHPLREEQITSAREGWQAAYGGPRNAKKTAVLGSDWDYKRLALTPQELDFLNSNKWSVQRICMALGVPPAIIGLQGDSQMGAGKEAEGHTHNFWIGTMLPLMSLVENTMNPQLIQNPSWRWNKPSSRGRCVKLGLAARALGRVPRGGVEGITMVFDRDEASVLLEDRNRLLDGTAKLWGMGIPFADLNEYYDLGLPDRPWHAEGFLPFSVTPASQAALDVPEPAAPPPAEEEQADPIEGMLRILRGAAETKNPRDLAWQRHNARLSTYAKRVRGAFRSHFVRQRMEMLKRIGAGKTLKAGLVAELLFDLSAENARLVASVKPVLQGVINQAGQEQYRELQDANNYAMGPRAEAWLKKLLKNAEMVNETNREELRAILEEGVSDGRITNTDELAAKIREFYREREDGGAHRAGETAATGAYNAARTDAQEQLGIERQEWLSARDGRVRPTHQDADGQIVAIGESFEVGDGELRFPGDPDGPIEEIINCRCVAVPVTGSDS